LLVLHTVLLYGIAIVLNEERPFLASVALGIATMAGGWVGHHLDHSRDSPLRALGNYYSPLLCGFSPSWWSEKHNRHHVSCNETGKDGDIQLMPFIFLWAPASFQDRWNRKFQHIYFGILYAILHLKWQYDSVLHAIATKNKKEIRLLAIHFLLYVVFFKVKVVLFGLLLSGTVTAFIVTSSHQSEEKITSKRELVKASESPYEINDYIKQQLLTTRNITTYNWFLNYLCGGMQYQIEHHLFPRVPLYKLSTVRPHVIDYCEANNIEYKEEGFWEMLARNYKTIHSFAALEL
jgi:fatty acid desaturase